MATEKGNGKTTERRSVTVTPARSKGQGQRREVVLLPAVEPGRNGAVNGARVAALAADDVKRAFLATSESGAGPRKIHFGTAVRYPWHGQPTGGSTRAADAGSESVKDIGGARSYDTSSAEAITRPRVKGFQLSRRARDPTLARAESAATAVIAIAERRARAPWSTVSAGGSVGRSPCETTRDGGDSTEASQKGDRQTALWEVGGPGEGAVPEVGGEESQAAGTAGAVGVPAAVFDGEAEMVTGSPGGTPAGNATTAPREPAAVAQTGEDDSAHEKPPVLPACQQPEDEAVTSASKQPERATTASPLLSSGEPQARVAGEATTMNQQDLPQPQPAPSRTAAAAAAGSDSIVTGDEFLSHRSKVRAVVFPRPHTHQARKRPAGPRGLEREAGAPGPGDYHVGGDACDGWGGAGRKGPLVAPKRMALKEKARVVVETRKVKEACRGGPGEYDIQRADNITRTRPVVGVIQMHPSPPPPPQARSAMLVAEIADRNQTKGCSRTKTRHVEGRRVNRSRGRSRGRSRSRSRSRNRNRSHGGGITGRWVYGSTARADSKAARRAGDGYFAEGHRRSSSSPSREECKGGEEKERSGSDTRRRDDEPRRRRDRRSPRRQSSSKGRVRSGSRRPPREREGGRSSHPRRGFRWGDQSSCGSGKKRNTSGSNRTHREDRSRSGVRGPRRLAWADDNVPRPSRDRGNGIYHSESRRHGNSGGGSSSCCSGSSSSLSRRKRNLPPRARYTRSSTTRRRRERRNTERRWRRRRRRRRSMPGQERSRQSAFETSESGSSVSFLSSSSSSSPRRHGGRARFDSEGRRRRHQHRRDRGLESDSSSSAFGGSGRWRRRRRPRKGGRNSENGGPGRRRGAWGEDGATEPSRSLSSSCRDYSSSEGCNSSHSSGDGRWEEEIDGVWRGFLTVSRRVPGGKFAPLERKGVGDKNRAAVERARLQRERERNVGYHDVRRSLTEERAPSAVCFAAQAEATARERHRMNMRRAKVQKRMGAGLLHRAWASECEDMETRGDGVSRGGEARGRSVDDPTRRRTPGFRYAEETPLPVPAARQRAEREARERKRHGWMEVNIHQKWVETPRGGGGSDGGGEFGRTTGREKVEVKRKGEAKVKPFDRALRPVDAMGPGRYESEDLAGTTRTGRLGDAHVPVMAVGVARKEAVGPRGERPEVAAEMDREDEGEEGGVLVLDVPDDVTTRGRRRIPGGVLSYAPRWT
ncbi:unnamed protein product, partial [Ectocarpus sp. 12 AP-2014]